MPGQKLDMTPYSSKLQSRVPTMYTHSGPKTAATPSSEDRVQDNISMLPAQMSQLSPAITKLLQQLQRVRANIGLLGL